MSTGPIEIAARVFLPFAACPRNPNADILIHKNRDWVVSMGICELDSPDMGGLISADFEELAARLFGRESLADLELITNLLTIVFMFDDMIDCVHSPLNPDPTVISDICRAVLAMVDHPHGAAELELPEEAQMPKLEGIIRGFGDVTRRLLERTDHHGIRHYRRSLSAYLSGIVSEWIERNMGAAPSVVLDVENYRTVRVEVGGIVPFLEVGAVLRRFDVAEHVRADPEFADIQASMALAAAYINDLFSAHKESLEHEPANLVLVLRASKGLDWGPAVLAACEIHDEEIARYLVARDSLLEKYDDPGLREYIRLIEDGLRGNFEWFSGATRRYAEASSTHLIAASIR